MKSIIHHGNAACPSVTQDGATHCPGHEVDVPEYTEDSLKTTVLVAVEFGYKCCERGDNLQKALADAALFFTA
jgi:hypothetical protein